MARRLTLVAGSGSLPLVVAFAAREAGDTLQVLDLVGRSDLGEATVRIQKPSNVIDPILQYGPSHLVLAGGVPLPDSERLALARALGHADVLSDLGIAGALSAFFGARGIRLLGAHQVVPSLLAQEGRIAGVRLDRKTAAEALAALRLARAVGRLDLGQAVVVSGNRPVAAEDMAGTDTLLERVAALRASGLTADGEHRLILAKALKPRQPRFADLPTIGPATVRRAAEAGVTVIVVEASRTIVLERAALETDAEALGVSVAAMKIIRG